MFRRMAFVFPVVLTALAACSSTGGLRNPLVPEKPFVATAVPSDFAIVVDENHDTFYTRQHIQQVITAADSMSRTTYTTFRDYNDTVSGRFTQESPLSLSQVQAMWNDVERYDVLDHSNIWINWASGADLYKRNTFTIQVRANGRTRTYKQTNGFSGAVRPLMLLVEAVRLPITQNAGTPVVGAPVVPAAPAAGPTTAPEGAGTMPATGPATRP